MNLKILEQYLYIYKCDSCPILPEPSLHIKPEFSFPLIVGQLQISGTVNRKGDWKPIDHHEQ